MKLSSSVLSVVVIAVFLCMLDKHVFGDEVECNTDCGDKYEPVCAQPSDEEKFETFKNLCELDKAMKCNDEKTWKFVSEGECTD
uniref:Putative salivary secreted kazaltype proteinase inhibitor n=2 Tax=Triatominae TaxID=70999 RepID=A0A0V0G4J9_TRIDM